MRKIFYHIIAAATTLVLLSCGGNTHKPLIGGISAAEEDWNKTESPHPVSDTLTEVGDRDDTERHDAFGLPVSPSGVQEIVLRRSGYVASYNKDTRIPNWVTWCLTRNHADGDIKRPRKAFHEDDDVPEPRATDMDYYNSGYDRGHLCPAADNKWSEQAMYDSFLFTNICPQNHVLNVGDWNEMENQCRRWAKEYGTIYIVCGPVLLNRKHKTIGRNRVTVPEAFFKVVLRMSPEPEAIGFIYRNTEGNRPKDAYMNTVDDIERITGIDFFSALPDNLEAEIEAKCNLDNWTR